MGNIVDNIVGRRHLHRGEANMKIKNILIISHYRCNFNCSYCNQRELEENQQLELKHILPFINYVAQHNQIKNIHFQFEGGETLIKWKTFIKPLIEYIDIKTDLIPTYSLFTNGTIYTNELFQFLKKYNVQVVLSLDGNKDVFELQRNNKNFDLVVENTKKYLTLPNTRINAVFTPATISKLEESYLFFVDIGAKQVSFTPDNNINTYWSEQNLILLKKKICNILAMDKKNKIIAIQNSLWNSCRHQAEKESEHHSSIRIFPNKKITFSSDPFLRNENKNENCTLDNFLTNFKNLDNKICIENMCLRNTVENCEKCISKYICNIDHSKQNNYLYTSPALCAMRVAFLISEELENYE